MKFQIRSVEIDGKEVRLSLPTDNNENVYTILIGKNASGKTKALSKAANSCLFANGELAIRTEIDLAPDSQLKPSQVIAVSNSRFDRFPSLDGLRNKRIETSVAYHYLGLAGYSSGPNIILAKACAPIIEGLERSKNNAEPIAKILDYIGFLPIFQIELRRSYQSSPKTPARITPEDFWIAADRSGKNLPFDVDFDEILPTLDHISEKLPKSKNTSLTIDLTTGRWDDNEFWEISHHIPKLIEYGFLKVSRFSLFSKATKDKIPLQYASSGQQCMLLMFFGMAGLIKDGSLICIDEPEISLHPRWQAEFIGILQSAFSMYRGCHFLIATHSPQIVSGLISQNGFIADLEYADLLLSDEYAKKSADFQLTQIFREPGYKNEYLIRMLLVILSKVAKNEQPDSDDMNRLRLVDRVRDRLDENDPVLHLLNQIRKLVSEK